MRSLRPPSHGPGMRMPRVTNARSGLRFMPTPVSVIEVESTHAPVGCSLQQEAPGLLVLRLLGLELNMEPFQSPVLDGVVRSFGLYPAGPGVVECRVQLEFDLPELPAGPEVVGGIPVITRLAVSREPLRSVLRGRRIGVDPAHGGQDVGARGPINLEERHVVLKIARRLAWHLEEAGCRVWLTREDDRDLREAERLELALQAGVEVLVSLHTAHERDPSRMGVRTLFAPATGAEPRQAESLAVAIQAALVERLGLYDRGVGLAAPAPVLPSAASFLYVAVETVCLANPYEEAFLRSCTFRDRIAQAIRNGLARFYAQRDAPGPELRGVAAELAETVGAESACIDPGGGSTLGV